MHPERFMIDVDEAKRIVLSEVTLIGAERVSLRETLDRVLAEDIVSKREHPPWDNSSMDGYAVQWEDVRGAAPESPVSLRVGGEVRAGELPRCGVGKGEAVQIMTGAPIPPGSDSVIRIEDTERSGDRAGILKPCGKGDNIRCQGEDIRLGDPVISKGAWVRPAEVGMLATAGYVSALVFRRPWVSVLATGDEVVEPGEPLGPEKIINSNGYSIAALVQETGAIPVVLDTARDNRRDLDEKVKRALSADIAVVVGGVSKGKYDYVKEVIRDLGCQMKFWQVAMRPGHPLAFGTFDSGLGEWAQKKPFFGLPGNPVSCMVTFYQFVRPAIRKMMGMNDLFLPQVEAVLEEEVRGGMGRRQFVRAVTVFREGGYTVRLTGDQGSGILRSMVQSNSLMVLPEDREVFKAGERVQVQLLPLR